MRARWTAIAGCWLALAAGGCTTNRIVVVAPPSEQTQSLAGAPVPPVQADPPPPGVHSYAEAPLQCGRPFDQDHHYQTPVQATPITVVPPAIPRTAHVAGCAAVLFKLAADGKPRDVSILRELPWGYGYGPAIAEAIGNAVFQPPVSEDDTYYLTVGIGYTWTTAPVTLRPINITPMVIFMHMVRRH